MILIENLFTKFYPNKKSCTRFMLVLCDKCKNERVITNNSKYKKNINNFCGSCSQKGLHDGKNNPFYGKKHTEEAKKKIGDANSKRVGALNHNYGKRMSDETKRKLSIAKKGTPSPLKGKCRPPAIQAKLRTYNVGMIMPEYIKIKISNTLKGRPSSMKGKKRTTESRKKQSESLRNNPKNSGQNSCHWNPNLSIEDRAKKRVLNPESKTWRGKIYERDNYTCQITGQKGGRLSAHHLDGWHWATDKRYNLDNGITICENIHLIFHMIYGGKYNTKSQFEEFRLYMKEVLENT